MKKKLLHNIAGITLALALLGLLAIVQSPMPTLIRVIAACVGISTCVLLGVVYYIMKGRAYRGE